MLVEPFSYQSIAWPDCDLAQLIGRQYGPKQVLQYQHIGIEPERSINSTYPRPSNSVDKLAKQRHAFGLFDIF